MSEVLTKIEKTSGGGTGDWTLAKTYTNNDSRDMALTWSQLQNINEITIVATMKNSGNGKYTLVDVIPKCAIQEMLSLGASTEQCYQGGTNGFIYSFRFDYADSRYRGFCFWGVSIPSGQTFYQIKVFYR